MHLKDKLRLLLIKKIKKQTNKQTNKNKNKKQNQKIKKINKKNGRKWLVFFEVLFLFLKKSRGRYKYKNI
jgi:hypothetical protein